jgi:murein L,D-transpeptidase YafK
MKRFLFMAVGVLLLAAVLAPWNAHAQAVAAQALADKSDQMVVFFDAQGLEILRLPATFGQARGHKQREGDKRTPEGDYTLFPARPSQDWIWFMPIDYPNEHDLMRGQARLQPVGTLGGAIGLHGTGNGFVHRVRQSFGENWTLGCIAVTNEDMEELRAMVTDPIPIRIQP